jgi:ABC-type xylose transport system permease subunit
MWWWVAPFLIVDLYRKPPNTDLWPHLPFWITILCVLLLGAILSLANRRLGYWDQVGHWGKCAFLVSGYCASLLLTLGIIVFLGGLEGGSPKSDPEGSFGMLMIPSALAYIVIGALICASISLFHSKSKSYNSGGPHESPNKGKDPS